MRVKKFTETAILPTRSTEGSAGYDLYVDIDKEVDIPPNYTAMLHTNIAVEIPRGYFGAVYARSGLSTKKGLRPATCVSVIDSDYRGEIGLPIYNDDSEHFQTIQPHERVAQLVIQPYIAPDLEEVDELDETDRGESGFGSSGR